MELKKQLELVFDRQKKILDDKLAVVRPLVDTLENNANVKVSPRKRQSDNEQAIEAKKVKIGTDGEASSEDEENVENETVNN